MINESKQNFWNDRSKLGEIAGSNDFLLKKLEQKVILEKIPSKVSVLDIGCGNGDTLLKLIKEKNCTGLGLDFSEGMVDIANKALAELSGNIDCSFMVAAVPNLPKDIGEFDYAFSERCIINLDNAVDQHKAFLDIMVHVKPNGYYLMVESSTQGLERTNVIRNQLGLDLMSPPWHNTFFDEEVVAKWATDQFELKELVPFSSTYHFLSRIVYAAVAGRKGEELKYDADINMLSLELPIIGNFGPTRMWVWHKKY